MADRASREHLDRGLSRAQRRLTEAVRELARVRRLQMPLVFAQLNVNATPAGIVAQPVGGVLVKAGCHSDAKGTSTTPTEGHETGERTG